MKLYIIHNADLRTDKNNVVAQSCVATKDHPHPEAIWYTMPVISVLIEHPQGRILFDTGLHPDFAKGIGDPEQVQLFPAVMRDDQRLEVQLAEIGLKPEDIDLLILSHLHFDHVGQIHLFHNIRTLAPAEDLAQKPGFISAHPNLKIEGVDGDREILPGIRLRKLPGHTAGLMGLQVTLPKTGTLLFTSDAAYCRENYGPPAKTPANCYDTLSYRASIEKIREIAEQGVKIVWGHDEALASEFHYLPEYYE